MATNDLRINPDPINEVNFLRWHEPIAGPIPVADFVGGGECLTEYLADLRPDSPCKVIAENDSEQYALPMVYGDQIRFVVNAPKDFGPANNLALSFLKRDAVTPVTSPTITYITEGGQKYLTATFSVPCAMEGRHNLILTLTADGSTDIIAVSNPARIINFQSSQHPTVFANFRHSVSQFGYPYSTALTFRQRFRIDALLTVPKPAETISTYEDRNKTTRFIGTGRLDRYSEFKTDHLDAATHEAISAMFMHDDLQLNNRAYRKTDSYETELENDTYALYQGSTRLKDLTFTTLQNNC